MLEQVNREEQLGIKYRYDQRTGQEILVIPSDWLETNIASTEFEKKSFESFYEEACRGKENVCNRVDQCKKFDEEIDLEIESYSHNVKNKRRKGSAVRR